MRPPPPCPSQTNSQRLNSSSSRQYCKIQTTDKASPFGCCLPASQRNQTLRGRPGVRACVAKRRQCGGPAARIVRQVVASRHMKAPAPRRIDKQRAGAPQAPRSGCIPRACCSSLQRPAAARGRTGRGHPPRHDTVQGVGDGPEGVRRPLQGRQGVHAGPAPRVCGVCERPPHCSPVGRPVVLDGRACEQGGVHVAVQVLVRRRRRRPDELA